jgi:hypothetical protein
MFTRTKLTLLLLLLSGAKIQSYGQVLIYEGDTLSCYNDSEMEKITIQILKAEQLDTIYKIQQKQIEYLNTVITSKDKQIINYVLVEEQKEFQLGMRDALIKEKENLIKEKEKEIKKQKVLKFIGTTFFLGTTIYFILF